ncbi:MAG: hypothetical protein GKR88_15465 [Flavobacteriaceae bacterium]|nr:MAG: hypothetical protein GKR88_15465 [Flavobacteriaceae bacterium]
MKKDNLQNKLFESGLIEKGNLEDIEAFKRQHKLEYALEHQKEYSKKRVRKTLILTHKEFAFLSEMASKHKMKLPPFMVYLMFKSLREIQIEPTDIVQKEILSLLRSIDNSFTEQCLVTKFNPQIDQSVIASNKEEVSKRIQDIEDLLLYPPKLIDWLSFQVQNDAQFIIKLLQEISLYLQNSHDYKIQNQKEHLQ